MFGPPPGSWLGLSSVVPGGRLFGLGRCGTPFGRFGTWPVVAAWLAASYTGPGMFGSAFATAPAGSGAGAPGGGWAGSSGAGANGASTAAEVSTITAPAGGATVGSSAGGGTTTSSGAGASGAGAGGASGAGAGGASGAGGGASGAGVSRAAVSTTPWSAGGGSGASGGGAGASWLPTGVSDGRTLRGVVELSPWPQTGQAPRPCVASTRSAMAICWSLEAMLAAGANAPPPWAAQVPGENCKPP